MDSLYILTVAINYACLIAAIWLGIFIVTRSSRSPVSWLTALTLLSVSGWFLNVLLALNPPPSPHFLPDWLTPLFWMWPTGSFQSGWGGWMQGWQVAPAIMFWHHVTMLMRPGRMNPWRWTRVSLGYAIAVAAIYVMANTNLMFTEGVGDPLYLNTLQQGKLFSVFMGLLFLFTIMSLINLLRSAKIAPSMMPRRQLYILAAATLTAGLSAPISVISYALDIPLPRVLLSILLGMAVLLMGYGVARYSALVERRVLGRDITYNGIAILLVALLYLVVGWVSVLIYGVPAAALVFIVVLAIFTHSLIDLGRQALDLIFLHRETRELRIRLRKLAAFAREPQALKENLSSTFQSLCASVRAAYGLILVFELDSTSELVSYRWSRENAPLPSTRLMFDDLVQPERGQLDPPLEDAALLIPLYDGGGQIGVLILGQPDNGLRYSQHDIDNLLELSDQVSNVLHVIQHETEFLSRLSELAQTQQPTLDTGIELIPTRAVEDALRNMHDYSYLGDSPLANLEQVKHQLSAGALTHLDLGREVHNLLLTALEKLRPAGDTPKEPIPREWFAYIILHDAYAKETQNRDIMSRLYISEGTFNRTRRAAIRSLAKALAEMEKVS
ncbi:MAG: hypothetical protein C3F07_19720 [Anaerolineales bacterium]|nr:MAG: hypothetical protein C3F07_19720 [Anaerolineales bacterium]